MSNDSLQQSRASVERSKTQTTTGLLKEVLASINDSPGTLAAAQISAVRSLVYRLSDILREHEDSTKNRGDTSASPPSTVRSHLGRVRSNAKRSLANEGHLASTMCTGTDAPEVKRCRAVAGRHKPPTAVSALSDVEERVIQKSGWPRELFVDATRQPRVVDTVDEFMEELCFGCVPSLHTAHTSASVPVYGTLSH